MPTSFASSTSTATTTVNKCKPGTFYSSGYVCIPCTAGTYQPSYGQTTCKPCPIGTYQPNTTSTECSQCKPGSYQNEIGSYSCLLCEAGTYQPDAGKSECIVCPGGTYQWQNGSQSCLKCYPGSYQNRTGGSACIPCIEGYYNSVTGSEACRRCEIGTFQNSSGQTFCFQCPKHYTTDQEGERSQRACFQAYCPEYTYALNISMFTISVTIPPTRIGQTGYSWNRCKNDSRKALVSAFCQNISRSEVKWTEVTVLEDCLLGQLGPTSPISAQLLNISKMDLNDNNLLNVLQETNKLIQLQENLTYVDFGYIADILGKVNTEDISKEVLNATLDTVDILIASNSSSTNIAQESPGDGNRILNIMEDITTKIEVSISERPLRLIKPNIATSVWEQVGNKIVGIQVLHSNVNFIRNDSIAHLQQEPADNELLDAAIFFQSDVLNATKNKLGMTVILNDVLFKAGSERYKVVSKIMAAKLFQNGVSITHLGKHYVRAVFISSEEDSRVVCGYWDYTLNQNGGGWISDGCNHTIDKKRHICTCNHLTNFAILVDLEAKSIPPEHEQALEFITYVGLILSIIGICLTILTFLCFRHLRRGRGQQTLFCLCIPMLCYSIIFLVGIKRTEYYVPCIAVSALIHYFILAAFMWMLMEGVLQYLRFVKVLGTYIPNFFIKTSIPAWGVPLVPVIALLAYDYNLYYGGLGFCWMKLEALYYTFVIPICLIILVNAIIFIMVTWKIFRRPKGMTINQSEWKMTLLSFKAALSIFVILGLTWIFGVVALGGAKVVFQYIFVILNAFQGFFIFLLFTAREKQVRDQWARFCCRKPTGHFTSLEQNSSSQDTFSTAVSGSNSSRRTTDNSQRQHSTSSQKSTRQSSL
ncbi:hypothetical protein CHS0354_008838 [Potamilus streckersoni]|uniref:Uncharacterized protein n=1 Tax=Potamilus streckersoni TaxID=2493646 RepID=A0AAE0SPE8_9BIVA|nr:hypothetical protein CHS0354_008838 [Potamilus streckersoni]